MLEIERGNTTSHSMENSLWKRHGTVRRQTTQWMKAETLWMACNCQILCFKLNYVDGPYLYRISHSSFVSSSIDRWRIFTRGHCCVLFLVRNRTVCHITFSYVLLHIKLRYYSKYQYYSPASQICTSLTLSLLMSYICVELLVKPEI
jgi:hypothetical protein